MRARVNLAAEALARERRGELFYWWLLVALFFEYARPGTFVGGLEAAKLNALIPLSLFVLVLFVGGMRSFKEIFADGQTRWLLAFMGLLLVQVQVADVTMRSYLIFEATLGYFFLFIIIARVVTTVRRLRGVFATLIAAHVFLIVMSPEVITNTEQRTYIAGGAFLGDGNDFSLSICILLPMAVFMAVGSKSRAAGLAWWGSVLLCVLAVVGTQSRGGTLGVLAVGAFLWSFSRRKGITLVAMILIGGIAALHASGTYFTRMSTITNFQGEGSAEGRIMVWKAAMRMALDRPVFGVGSGHFAVTFGAKYKPADYVGPQLNAHSVYFQILGELGFPGIIVYVALVLGGIVRVNSLRRRLVPSGLDPPSDDLRTISQMLIFVAASGIGFGVAGAFLSAAYYPHIFVLSGVMVSACALARDVASRQTAADSAATRTERVAPSRQRGVKPRPAKRGRAFGRSTPDGTARPPRAR